MPSHRPPVSVKTLVLVALVALTVLTVFPFAQAYVRQQHQLSQLNDDVAARQARVDDLANEAERWQDDAFIITQARQRFTFVMPGEIGYVVLDEPRFELDRRDPSRAAARTAAASDSPWYATVWESVRTADQGPGS